MREIRSPRRVKSLRAPRRGVSTLAVRQEQIRQPSLGTTPETVQEAIAQESRAVPLSQVFGTILERIVYKALLDKAIPFDFQCLAGHHKVLMADLTWRAIADLVVGDRLINFNADGPRRNFRYGEVEACAPVRLPAKRVILSNGDEFLTTEEHPWLANWAWRTEKWHHGERSNKLSWLTTSQLYPGVAIPKILTTWTADSTWDAGYLAGFCDGEGSLVQSQEVTSLTASQNAGPTFDRFVQAVATAGFAFSLYDYRDRYKRSYDNERRQVIHLRIKGGRQEVLRFLGTIRPPRLLARFDANKLMGLPHVDRPTVEAIEDAGPQDIYKLAVSGDTYIADGYGMHNSSLVGGRAGYQFGRQVADFVLWRQRIVIECQGTYWHAKGEQHWRDVVRELVLAGEGWTTLYLEQDTILDPFRLNDWLDRHVVYGAMRQSNYSLTAPLEA